MKYRSDIDGLRAVAVIAVIFYHINERVVPSGFLGVDVFFAISGFVITASLFSLPRDQGFTVFLIEFYNRRIRRIVPALALSSVLGSVMISMFYFTPELSLNSAIIAQYGLSNLYFLHIASDYFADSPTFNAFLHTWSLGVEEQFYFIYPAIIWFAFFRRIGTSQNSILSTSASRNSERSESLLPQLVFLLAALSFVSFVMFVVWHQSAPLWSFFLMPARFWELASGAFCYFWLSSKRFGQLRPDSVITGISLFLLLAIFMYLPQGYSLYTTPVAVLCTCLLIVARPFNRISGVALGNQASVYIGRISYSLYLFHWPVIILGKLTIGISSQTFLPLLAFIFFLSAMTYHFVELPMRIKKWSERSTITILYGLALSFGASALIFLLLSPFKSSLYLGGIPELEQIHVQSLITPYEFGGGVWQGIPCILSAHDSLNKTISSQECTLGNLATAKHRVLVIGNSYSAAFVRGFDKLIDEDSFAVTITSSWGASVVPNIPAKSEFSESNLNYWTHIVPRLFSELRSGDWVVMLNDLNGFYTATETATPAEQEKLELLKAGLTEISAKLALRGIRVAFLGGLPLAREANCAPDQAILTWYNSFQGGRCLFFTKEYTRKRLFALDQTLASLVADRKIKVIDLFDLFCSGEMCTYHSQSGQMLFRDRYSHPSVEAARMSAPTIRNVLTEK